MNILIALVYLVLAAVLIYRMLSTGKVVACHLGIVALFAIGYYILPIGFTQWSNLSGVTENDVTSVLVLHGLFLGSLVGSSLTADHVVPKDIGLRMRDLDFRFAKNRRSLFLVGFIIYVAITLFTDQTSYASADFDAYFTDRSRYAASISIFSNALLGLLTLAYAVEIKGAKSWISRVMTAALLGIVALSLSTAQRLAIITPLAMIFTALVVSRQRALAVRCLGLVVLVLVLVSPFAVFLRQTRVNERGKGRVFSVGQDFSYGDEPVTTMVASIVGRSDLLGNSIQLKEYIDEQGFVGWKYYYSVLVNPIPRQFFEEKPFLLSSDGTMAGDLSVIAWGLNFGGIGSLTAFGGISAYREGGWIAVAIDGALTGLLFVMLARWLGNGGAIAQVFYITLLPLLSIKRVPPSFFEALGEVAPLVPVLVALMVLSRLLSGRNRHRPKPWKATTWVTAGRGGSSGPAPTVTYEKVIQSLAPGTF